jgi:hypothetical protein
LPENPRRRSTLPDGIPSGVKDVLDTRKGFAAPAPSSSPHPLTPFASILAVNLNKINNLYRLRAKPPGFRKNAHMIA